MEPRSKKLHREEMCKFWKESYPALFGVDADSVNCDRPVNPRSSGDIETDIRVFFQTFGGLIMDYCFCPFCNGIIEAGGCNGIIEAGGDSFCTCDSESDDDYGYCEHGKRLVDGCDLCPF
jgi:hypothetical protein